MDGIKTMLLERYHYIQGRLGLTFYHRPTHQKSLTQHPHHVDVSESLFTDLTMVGVLYKLDAFFLKRALIQQTVGSFFLPFGIYIALFDAWEVRPTLDAQFKRKGSSIYLYLVYLALWMLIALMGTAIEGEAGSKMHPNHELYCEEFTNSSHNSGHSAPLQTSAGYKNNANWGSGDALLFASFKAAHALIRVGCYVDIVLHGISHKSRRGAIVRLIMYSIGAIPLIICPVLINAGYDLNVGAGMFVLSFFLQKLTYLLLWIANPFHWFTSTSLIKINWPFFIHRLREWTELQLGACILGLIAFDVEGHFDIQASQSLQIAVMVSGYVLIASLDFFSYATHPPDFKHHALAVGGFASQFWTDGFAVTGIGLLGMQVGLRYALLSPVFDHCTHSENTHLMWLLTICVFVIVVTLLLQQWMHVNGIAKKRFWFLKLFFACTMLIAPLTMIFNIVARENISIAFYILLNATLSVLAILFIHGRSGGFQKKIIKRRKLSFMAYSIAAVMAIHWLNLARRRIEERKKLLQDIGASGGSLMLEDDQTVKRTQSQQQRRRRLKREEESERAEDYDSDYEEFEEEEEEEGAGDDDASDPPLLLTDNKPSLMNRLQQTMSMRMIPTASFARRQQQQGLAEMPPLPSSLLKQPSKSDEPPKTVSFEDALNPQISVRNIHTMNPELMPQQSISLDQDVQNVNGAHVDDVESQGNGGHHQTTAHDDDDVESNGNGAVYIGSKHGNSSNSDNPAVSSNHTERESTKQSKIEGGSTLKSIPEDHFLSASSSKAGGGLSSSDDGSEKTLKSIGEWSNQATTATTNSETSHRDQEPSITQVFLKTLNRRFYDYPRLIQSNDIFAEFKTSWSDLFLDIIYVGAVFRLGDYLTGALGLGHDKEAIATINGLYYYICLFAAVFSCWWSKLSYTSKCGVSDVVHKIMDVIFGFFIFTMSALITSPQEMNENLASLLTFSVALLLFHLGMALLWIELGVICDYGQVQFHVARRNLIKSLESIFAVAMAIICITVGAPFALTAFFLASTWLFPVLDRFVHVFFPRKGYKEMDEVKLELLVYAQHRVGDLSLLWLGEGVMQVLRYQNTTQTVSGYSFAVFAFAFLNLSMCRTLLFKLGCFEHETLGKHTAAIVPRGFQRDFSLALIHVARMASGFSIVGMGIGLKKMVALTTEYQRTWSVCEDVLAKKGIYGLFSGSATITHFLIVFIYHVHRANYKSKRGGWKKRVAWGIFSSGLFMILPYIPCIPALTLLICTNVFWLVSLIVHLYFDDFLRHDSHSRKPPLERHGSSFMEMRGGMKLSSELLKNAKSLLMNIRDQDHQDAVRPLHHFQKAKGTSAEELLATLGSLSSGSPQNNNLSSPESVDSQQQRQQKQEDLNLT